MKNTIANYMMAGYPAIYIISHEEQRIEGEIESACKDALFHLFDWSLTKGVTHRLELRDDKVSRLAQPTTISDTEPPFAMLDEFAKLPERSVCLLRDFHLHLEEKDAGLYRKFKDALLIGKSSNRVLIIVGCRLILPPELEKEVAVIEATLPDRAQLQSILKNIAASAGVKLPADTDAILDAASGLTTNEAENAFALSVVETKTGGGKSEIHSEIVAREKAATVKKNGIVEIIETNVTIEDVGGLENFKEELIDKKDIFTQEWREYYGDDFITAMMVVGQPGTGKTLTAKATRSIFNIPLLRLEAGRLFGSLVGQSESNYRTAIGTAKAIAPCILWVDEIDGLFSGAESSGRTDGGTTDRIIKAFLQDMQEVKGVLWFFTCNDIDKLPDPLIDRCEVWSVDLPNREERKAILSIHIAKRKRNPAKFNLDTIAEALEGFSGRQIERAWLNAMAAAFNDGKREPKNADLIDAAKKFTPTSITMRDAIERRRARLVNRARQASRSDAPVTEGRIRKIA